jgi:hypothetical protein
MRLYQRNEYFTHPLQNPTLLAIRKIKAMNTITMSAILSVNLMFAKAREPQPAFLVTAQPSLLHFNYFYVIRSLS